MKKIAQVLTEEIETVKTTNNLGETMCCKECGFVIDQDDICSWTTPETSTTKVSVQFGHPTDDSVEEKFRLCLSGQYRVLDEYSTGKLFQLITHKVFYLYNYLGKLNWYDLPIDYVVVANNAKQTIVENSLHTGFVLAVPSLGNVEIDLPDVTGFPPYGLDVFVHQTAEGTAVKINGLPIDIWLCKRNHNIVICWCGDAVGYLISSGKYLTSAPS